MYPHTAAPTSVSTTLPDDGLTLSITATSSPSRSEAVTTKLHEPTTERPATPINELTPPSSGGTGIAKETSKGHDHGTCVCVCVCVYVCVYVCVCATWNFEVIIYDHTVSVG